MPFEPVDGGFVSGNRPSGRQHAGGSYRHSRTKTGLSGHDNIADIHNVTQRFGCFAGPSKKSMFCQ